mgnify:CR=1 FL=1
MPSSPTATHLRPAHETSKILLQTTPQLYTCTLLAKPPQPQHAPDIGRESQAIEHGQEVEQALVVGVVDPALDRDPVSCAFRA